MKLIELYGPDIEVLDEAEPSLVAAVKHIPTGKIYRGRPGQAHWDVAKENGFARENWKHDPDVQTGFVNHKGMFIDRERALAYAAKHDMLHPLALKYLSDPDTPAALGASFLKR